MSAELLFEIGTEEIPAGYILPALEALQAKMAARLAELGLNHGEIKSAATPRRLTLCVENLAKRQEDRSEEVLGPPKKAAFDAQGQPTKAALGFAKSRGVSLDAMKVVLTPKGEYLMVLEEHNGQATQDVLAGLLPELITAIPFPKSMRWGSNQLSFARPIQWILALFGGEPVPFSIQGVVEAGAQTYGHRFMAPGALSVKNYADYISQLRDHHVIANLEERTNLVIEQVEQAAHTVGGQVLHDPGLIDTVSNLVEKPHAICGSFDQKFLALPKEVLITSMREHQKYFAVISQDEKLMAHFIAVNNTGVKDLALAAEGHQRVLRARLEDAMFFFNDDQKKTLANHVEELSGIVFQAKLGTMKEKTERVMALTGWLAEQIEPSLAEKSQRAAYLAKADLLTAMVNEFPTLQGVMGRDYAKRDGEDAMVAQAIAEHYMPVRAGSALPESRIGALLSIADRVDTIAGCFGIGQLPTGTTDPFGLRRQALGMIHIISDKKFTLSLTALFSKALDLLVDKITAEQSQTLAAVKEFIKGRFINDLVAKGTPVENVEAVTSVLFDDLRDCSLKIKALQAMGDKPSFPVLAGSFKRVMNIIKEHQDTTIKNELLLDEAEKNLYTLYKEVAEAAEPLIARQEYQQAMENILRMKEPIDKFFDEVMVMAEDAQLKNNRLALLTSIAALFLKIGDFSKMYALSR